MGSDTHKWSKDQEHREVERTDDQDNAFGVFADRWAHHEPGEVETGFVGFAPLLDFVVGLAYLMYHVLDVETTIPRMLLVAEGKVASECGAQVCFQLAPSQV